MEKKGAPLAAGLTYERKEETTGYVAPNSRKIGIKKQGNQDGPNPKVPPKIRGEGTYLLLRGNLLKKGGKARTRKRVMIHPNKTSSVGKIQKGISPRNHTKEIKTNQCPNKSQKKRTARRYSLQTESEAEQGQSDHPSHRK